MKHLSRIFVVIGVVGLGVVILLNLKQLSSFTHLITHIHLFFVLIVILIQLASYYLNALYYRSILRVFGYSIRVLRLFEGALAANFVNYIAPTAGMAGAAFLSQVLRPEVPRGKGVLTQIMRYALSALAVLLMMPIGILLVVATRRHSNVAIDHVAVTSAGLILLLAILVVGLVHQERILRKLVSRLSKWLEKHFKKFKS